MWCSDANYCDNNNCSFHCEHISEVSKCTSDCSWCESMEFCHSDAYAIKCFDCEHYSEKECPPGCNVCSSDSNISLIIILIVIGVIVIAFIIALFLRLRSYKPRNIASTDSEISVQFTDLIDCEAKSSESLDSFSESKLSEFLKCDKSVISFSDSKSVLLLNKEYSEKFTITNVSHAKLTYELLITGIKEKHSIIIEPSSFTLKPGDTQSIKIEATFHYSTDLTSSEASVTCKIIDNHIYNKICRLNIITEVTPLIAIDDIILGKEIGAGSFSFFIFLIFFSFGKVFSGFYHGSNVAIKKFSSLTLESNNNEVQIYSKLRSPYVVEFYGINPPLNLLIIEYCEYGSVDKCYSNKKMNKGIKILICYDCAMGMNVFFIIL